MSRVPSGLLILVFASVTCGIAYAQEPASKGTEPALVSDPDLTALLEPIRAHRNVPGLVAGIVRDNRLDVIAAAGVRKAGSDNPITVADELHIGSCTKAMTATLLARLIDESRLKFESTIGEIFSDVKHELHPDFHAVTLEQLLTHRAGLPANTDWRGLGNGTHVEQRSAVLKRILSQPPVHPPGTKFLYSNVGYVIAGHMAEEITGKPWEELMRELLFTPLEMPSAGFGPPGMKNEIDQPWGHDLLLGRHVPLQKDNAAVLGPAGTVHCTLADWGKFAALHLEGARGGSRLLKAETFRRLHTAPDGDPRYACGWIISERDWAGGKVLTHAGSNTMWLATVWIAPERNCALLAVANQGGEAGTKACDDAIGVLIQRIGKKQGAD
jgi:CubicO group peptidase (beta-lactamase class C family)